MINTYFSPGTHSEKYADEIFSFIIDRCIFSNIPHDIVNAVQRWCDDNLIRLNVTAKKNEQLPTLTLSNGQLEMVSSYKYLGVDLNVEIDSFMQLSRDSGLIKPNIYLLKQLNSSVLDSCTTATKNDMQVRQNRMFRIIGLNKETAYSKYGILYVIGITKYVSDFIELSRLEQIKRIHKTHTHSLPISLSSYQYSHFEFNHTIPIARAENSTSRLL